MSTTTSAAARTEELPLTSTSLAAKEEHDVLMRQMEIKTKANSMLSDVPTLPQDVQKLLRRYNQPIRLFGENPAETRTRLQYVMAERLVMMEERGGGTVEDEMNSYKAQEQEEELTSTTYTHASSQLQKARRQLFNFSMEQAKDRLLKERKRRMFANELESVNARAKKLYSKCSNYSLYSSQYAGDGRILSSVKYSFKSNLIITCGWSAMIQAWDMNFDLKASYPMAHEDRVMNIQTHQDLIGTASIDTNAKLFSLQDKILHKATFVGHKARLSRIAFAPLGNYIATTSYDHTWRLWDIQTSTELQLQDGHIDSTFGIQFHPDNSLVAVSDLQSVIQLWDVRSGKSIAHFLGHAQRVLNVNWCPNGFQLFTSGDDGFIKVWDVRMKQLFKTIPAHSRLITNMAIEKQYGELLASCSFDGFIKLWNTRDWSLVRSLKGHDGKVMDVDFTTSTDKKQDCTGLVSVGFDKTVKIWR